jgi:hypothetical protein
MLKQKARSIRTVGSTLVARELFIASFSSGFQLENSGHQLEDNSAGTVLQPMRQPGSGA